MKPLNTDMDAERWAKEFMELFGHKLEEIDQELMHSWFANSIMCGWDNANWRRDEKENQ